MQAFMSKAGELLDTAAAFLRDLFMQYPLVVSAIGGAVLMVVLLTLVVMPLRIAWWRFICWRNRLAGKLSFYNYEAEIADAIIAITNRYWVQGRLSSGQRKERFRILAQALNLPQLHDDEPRYHRPLHPEAVARLKAKSREELAALKKEPVHAKVGSKATPAKKLKITVIDGGKKVA